mmetsp:Transcript_1780/g.2628  ORF Transcript_1780/g.2628 Transcript_1780/m.2628 type:complete len:206 (-) Transcript_1780:54-671(-)
MITQKSKLRKQLSKKKMRVNTKNVGGIKADFEVPSPLQDEAGPIALNRRDFVSGNQSVMVNVFQQSDFVHTPTTPEGKNPLNKRKGKAKEGWEHVAAQFSPNTPPTEEGLTSPMAGSSPLTRTKQEEEYTAMPRVGSKLTLDQETLDQENIIEETKTPSNLKSKYFKKPAPLRRINTGLQNGYKKPHFLKSPSPVVEFKPLPKEV